jgi:hypothetical protein
MWFSTLVDDAVDSPPSGAGRLKVLGALLAVAVVVLLGERYGYIRGVVGVAMFLGILFFGARYIRQLGMAPPEPEISDVSDYGLKYVCTMCGLELKVEKAARDKAPTHCMEPMVLVREDGKPPLRPV